MVGGGQQCGPERGRIDGINLGAFKGDVVDGGNVSVERGVVVERTLLQVGVARREKELSTINLGSDHASRYANYQACERLVVFWYSRA